MGVRATRSKEYNNLTIGLLERDTPKAYVRFVDWYSLLSYKPGYDWIKDGPRVRDFFSLPILIRMSILMEFFTEYKLLGRDIKQELDGMENEFEFQFNTALKELELRL